MDEQSHNNLVQAVVKVLLRDARVVFAYLYGSSASGLTGRDMDIAVYLRGQEDPYGSSADLKYLLYRETGLDPDIFDIRVLNKIDEHGDLFGLLYLKNVLEQGRILVDKDPDVRADFLERYGLRYRECEGLIQEVLA